MTWRRLSLLFVLSVAVFLPTLRYGTIWDDDAHITAQRLQSGSGLLQIWLKLGATQQYYPVLHTAFWIEHRAWGGHPFGYHLVNVLLHALAACGVALAVDRLFDRRRWAAAWLAGAIFAVHPTSVETVAWISEQKNTLSVVFYLAAALCWWRRERGWSGYVAASALFLLALGCKTVTATLPAALLVLGWWQDGKISWNRNSRLLVPWLAAGAAAGGLTAWVERHLIGASGAAFSLTIGQRLLVMGRAPWFYLGKLLWPAHLVFFYPRWTLDPRIPWQWASVAATLAAVTACWQIRRRSRAPLAASLYFGGTLFPVLGFLNVYPFLFSFVADHFQYLARLGVIVAVSAAATAAGGRSRHRRLFGAAAALYLLALIGLTLRQEQNYRDGATLYRATLAENPRAWAADNNLGVELAREGRLDEAAAHYAEAIHLNDRWPDSYNNLGNVRLRQHRVGEAIDAFQAAVGLKPDYAVAYMNLGVALTMAGRSAEAVPVYGKALQIDPEQAHAHNDLGVAWNNLGRPDRAVAEFQRAVELDAHYPEAELNLADGLARLGRTTEAGRHYRRALQLAPGSRAAEEGLRRLPLP
jgi:Flp pilus assembly protein TadD